MQQAEPSSAAAASDSPAPSSFRFHVLPVQPASDCALSAQDSTLLLWTAPGLKQKKLLGACRRASPTFV
jgi:hypothetical protein